MRPAEICPTEVGMTENRFAEIGAAEVRAAEVCAVGYGAGEICTAETGLAEVGATKQEATEVGAVKVRTAERRTKRRVCRSPSVPDLGSAAKQEDLIAFHHQVLFVVG